MSENSVGTTPVSVLYANARLELSENCGLRDKLGIRLTVPASHEDLLNWWARRGCV